MKRHRPANVAKATVVALLLLVFLGSFLFFISKCTDTPQDVYVPNLSDKTQIQTIDGVKYRQKKTVNYLFIGLDKTIDEVKKWPTSLYYNRQQADFLAVLSVDTTAKQYSVLQINRDTLVNYKMLGAGGNNVGTAYGQIALSHTQAGGGAASAYNTVDAVKKYLYNVTIDYYVVFTMDAIARLNDEVIDLITGVNNHGVPVTLSEGQSLEGMQLTHSTLNGNVLTLHGEDALTYVRGRAGVDDQTNVSRMVRQKQYINSFIDITQGNTPSQKTMLDCYEALTKDDVVTMSSSMSDLNDLFGYFTQKDNAGHLAYRNNGVFEPKGVTSILEGHVAFTPDVQDLQRVVTTIFFDKV